MSFKRAPRPRSADQFIEAAATSVQPPAAPAAAVPSAVTETAFAASAQAWPWEGKREGKATEVFNLRLTEVELEKLRYIAAHTPDSMQAFVRKVLIPAIDAKLAELTR